MKVSEARSDEARRRACARVLPVIACTVPPCGHIMHARAVSRPAMLSVTSSAPSLTLTSASPTATLLAAALQRDAARASSVTVLPLGR